MKLAWVRWEDHWKSLVGLPPSNGNKKRELGSFRYCICIYIYIYLVGGLEPWNFLTFQKELGMSPSQLTNSFFQRGWNHQPVYIYIYMKMIYVGFTQCHQQLPFGGGFRKKNKPLWWWFWDGFVFFVSHIIQLKFRSLRSDGNSWAQREEWTSSGPGIAVISTEFLWPELCWNLFFSNALGA